MSLRTTCGGKGRGSPCEGVIVNVKTDRGEDDLGTGRGSAL
jgi:hypothetical protein